MTDQPQPIPGHREKLAKATNYARHRRVYYRARWLHQVPNWRLQLGLGVHVALAVYNLPDALTVALDVGLVLRLGRRPKFTRRFPFVQRGPITQVTKATQWAVQIDWADVARVGRPAVMRGRDHARG